MKQGVRACVAYVAGRLISKLETSTIYDASQSKHLVISGNISAGHINIHDYARDCLMSGTGDNASYSLYDHGAAHHLTLVIDGDQFEGYDFGSICHFRGKVDGANISFYDYGETGSFSYSL